MNRNLINDLAIRAGMPMMVDAAGRGVEVVFLPQMEKFAELVAQHIGDPDGEAFRTAVRLGMEVKVNLRHEHSTARCGDYVRTEDHVGGAAAGTRAVIRLVDAEFKRRERAT